MSLKDGSRIKRSLSDLVGLNCVHGKFSKRLDSRVVNGTKVSAEL